MKKILTTCILLGMGGLAYSQGYMGLHFVGSSPLNTFCDTGYRNGYGINFEFLSNNLLRKSTNANNVGIRFGLAFDYQAAGKEKYDVTLNTPDNDPGYLRYNNSHLGFRGIMRISFLDEGRVNPYFDAFTGLRGFYSHKYLSFKEPRPDYESEQSEQIMNGWTWRYGGSLGVQYRINSTFSVDTRVTYSRGSETDWLNMNTLNMENQETSYRTSYTTTDLLIYTVGITIRFNGCGSCRSGSSTTPSDNSNNDNQQEPQKVTKPKKKKNITVTPGTPGSTTPKKPIEVKPTPEAKPKPAY